MDSIQSFLKAAIHECCPPEVFNSIVDSNVFSDISFLLKKDLESYAKKDPASNNNAELIIRTSLSYAAVLHYRLANAIYYNERIEIDNNSKEAYAAIISSRGKLKSGAEIHYKAKIKEHFVLDHGFGTVIGETTEIGSHCYILGGVVCGARGISANEKGKRHPIIGNYVQIGAFSSILGPISVGDNVFIGPHCIVTQDVPRNRKILNRDSQGCSVEILENIYATKNENEKN